MKAKVTKEGVVIPKRLLEDVEEVEIRKENNLIVVIPTVKEDPIRKLGTNPVVCNAKDASENPDKYIYGNNEWNYFSWIPVTWLL